MPLPYRINKKEEIPSGLESHYLEKKEGEAVYYVLDTEGVVPSARLDEFRNTNRELHKKINEFETKFEGVDPENYRNLTATVGNLKPDEITELLKKGKDVDKVVEQRIAAVKQGHEQQVKTFTTEIGRLTSRLSDLSINQAVIERATKLGLRPSAQPDITSRAQRVFTLNPKGDLVALEADGKTPKYGKDGTPLTIQEWVEALVAEAPHLFAESKGSGGSGDGSGGQAGGGAEWSKKNPFKKGTQFFNLTEQGKLMKENPTLARRLMVEAGIKPPAHI